MILFEVPVSTQAPQTVGFLRGKIFVLNDFIDFSPPGLFGMMSCLKCMGLSLCMPEQKPLCDLMLERINKDQTL